MISATSISVALGSLKAAADIAQSMMELNDAAAFRGKMIEFQNKIIAAQNAAITANDERTTLLETIGNLEKKVTDFEAWETEKQKYELKEVDLGAFAYVLKKQAEGAEPTHWICARCYSNSQKSILQSKGCARPEGGPGFLDTLWKCFACNSEIITQQHISPKSSGGN